MSDRADVASAFTLAAIAVWVCAGLILGPLVAGIGAACSIPVTLALGAAVGHRFAEDARKSRDPGRGILAGIYVTVAAYVLSALALGVWFSLSSLDLSDIFEAFTFCLVFGLLFATPGLVPGSIAGYLLYLRIIKADQAASVPLSS